MKDMISGKAPTRNVEKGSVKVQDKVQERLYLLNTHKLCIKGIDNG